MDPAGLSADVVQEIISSVRDIRSTQIVSFIAASIVIYDYVVCLEREVELIWKKRWSVIKLAFLWHRYFGVLCVLFQAYALNTTAINDKFCSFWFYWETWGYSVILFTSEAVLALWIYVVYNKNHWILALMGVCYAGEVAAVVTILTKSFETYEARAIHIPGADYCAIHRIGPLFPLLWVPILSYDGLLLLLFLYRGCAGLSRKRGWRSAYTSDGLLDMIYRHSLLNFLAIFISYLFCAVIWLTSDIGRYQVPVGFALALSLTNCTRLLLNIRRAYYSGVSDALLCNIRRIPATGNNTPIPPLIADSYAKQTLSPTSACMLVGRSPRSPSSAASESAYSQLSGPTLHEPSLTPTSTLRASCASPTALATHGYEHWPGQIDDPAPETPAVVVRTVGAGPRHAGEYVRAGPGPAIAVRLSSVVDPEWWQLELREMRAEAAGRSRAAARMSYDVGEAM